MLTLLFQATESSQKLRLELSSHEEKQQLMAELATTQQQTASLEHQLSCLNRELTLSRKLQQKQTPPTPDTEGLTKLVKLSQMEVERLQRLLSEERQEFSKLQEREVTMRSQLEEYQKSRAELSKELTEIKKVHRNGYWWPEWHNYYVFSRRNKVIHQRRWYAEETNLRKEWKL